MTPAQQRKKERDEERIKKAYETQRARELAMAAIQVVLKDGPAPSGYVTPPTQSGDATPPVQSGDVTPPMLERVLSAEE